MIFSLIKEKCVKIFTSLLLRKKKNQTKKATENNPPEMRVNRDNHSDYEVSKEVLEWKGIANTLMKQLEAIKADVAINFRLETKYSYEIKFYRKI